MPLKTAIGLAWGMWGGRIETMADLSEFERHPEVESGEFTAWLLEGMTDSRKKEKGFPRVWMVNRGEG